MGIFDKDPQRHFEGMSFTVTRTLFDPPALSMLPAVYVDDGAQLWAVRLPSARPRILRFSDIVRAEVVEDDGEQDRQRLAEAGRKRLAKTLLNPNAISKANAAKKGRRGFGLGVAVAVRNSDAPIQITFVTRAIRKDSAAYAQLHAAAESLRLEFEEMAKKG